MSNKKERTFNKEKPIETVHEDQKGLNRANFAKNLAINIENYFKYNTECLTIGLMGEWGSGKTSIINLTKDFIDEDINIMEFNPWIYSSYNQLIGQFFDELISQFSDEAIIKDLQAYWLKLNKSNLIKSASSSLISFFSKELGEFIEKNIIELDSEEESLKKIKDNINKELENHKIVCIMDDFDRITVDEIKELFRLIKIMADFNNIIYIISFDKTVVADALGDNYGEKFLEKIINVPLEVPFATHDELKKMLKNNLMEISKVHNLGLDEDRLDSFLEFSNFKEPKYCGISYLFNNVRDIKRFINTFEFNIDLIKNEVNPVDFIVITAIQLFSPDVYDKIKCNESLLIEYKLSMSQYSSNPDFTKKEQEKFEKIVGNDENMKFILKRLFPKMSFIYRTNHISDNSSKYDSNLLICSENHFKTYFKLNSIVKKITEEKINEGIDFINSEDEPGFINYLENLLGDGKFELFFDRLPTRIKKIEKPKFFLKLIFSFDNKLDNNFLDLNVFTIRETCLWLLNLIKKVHRFEIFKNEVEKSKSIYFIFKLIKFIELNKFLPYEKEPLFSESEINELKDIVKTKYPKFISEYSKNPNKYFRLYLDIGTYFDLKFINDEFIKDLISSKEGLILFLDSLVNVNMKHFIESEISNIEYFAGMETIYEKINEYEEDLKDLDVVKKFLKDYEIFKSTKNDF